MPAALTRFLDTVRVPRQPQTLVFVGASLVGAALVFAVAGIGADASASVSSVEPLYHPSTSQAVTITDVQNMTVLQVVQKLPNTSRFDMLLSNSGVRHEVMGQGPYTVFAPADNYFDYLPAGAYIALTRQEERELAEHMVVPHAAVGTDDTGGQYITLAQDTVSVAVHSGAVSVGKGLPAGRQGFAIQGYRASNGIVYVINRVVAPADLPQLQ